MTTLLQVWCGSPPIERLADKLAASRGWDYYCMLLPEAPTPQAAVIASDNARYEYLAEHPDTIYCDVDCTILDAFEYVRDGRPHAGFYPPESRREVQAQPDSFLIYGPCEFFRLVLSERDRRGLAGVYCWPRKVLRDRPEVQQIAPSAYIHYRETAIKPHPEQGVLNEQR